MKKLNNCNTILYFSLLFLTSFSLIFLRTDLDINYSLTFIISLLVTTIGALLCVLKIKNIILRRNEDYYSQLSTRSYDSENSLKDEINLQEINSTNIQISDNVKFNKSDGIFDKIKYEKGKIILNDINKPHEQIVKSFDFSEDKQADFNSKQLEILYFKNYN